MLTPTFERLTSLINCMLGAPIQASTAISAWRAQFSHVRGGEPPDRRRGSAFSANGQAPCGQHAREVANWQIYKSCPFGIG